MGIITIIKSVLKSLELYLELRNKSFYLDIESDHKRKKDEIIKEIEKCRASGDYNDSTRADILRQQLQNENERFERISAAYSEAERRKNN